MSILLTTLNAKYIHSNLAIRILYQLNKHHDHLSWKEFTIKEPIHEIAFFCSQYSLVAFSCYIWNIEQTLQVCEAIKKINPTCKILLGGPEVSYEYELLIVKPYIDYIVVGEGEFVFQEILSSFPRIEQIKGLVYKQNEQIVYTPNHEVFDVQLLQDINPYEDDDIDALRNKVLYIETSRGCPYKCEFCLASLDNKVRYLPMETIKKNLLFMMKHGRTIKFLDRTFNIKKDFTIAIFDFILQHKQTENVFQFEITADILHQDIISFVQQKIPKGLFRFEVGIQTVNQQANLQVSRKQSFEKTTTIIKQVEQYVDLHLDLIVGLPLDYWSDIKYSIEEVFKLFAPELQLGFLKFLKGTPMRTKAMEHNYIYETKAPYQIIKSNYLSTEELQKIVKLEFALEAYWNKKRIINTMKYIANHHSIFDFMLGLGEYFETVSHFHKHTLEQLYTIAHDFILKHYQDKHILQLLALDYYLQHKVKPKTLFVQEVSRPEKIAFIESNRLDHHRYRFGLYQLGFDANLYVQSQVIKESKEPVVICYNGKEKPAILASMISVSDI
ncbi:MAG: DUF4080 domain-containing protein [Chitinophagaceae bacterium]